jgi:hypothetical protein
MQGKSYGANFFGWNRPVHHKKIHGIAWILVNAEVFSFAEGA